MKVVTIEIVEAIEKEISGFLKDWGGGYAMRFTRFIDLGGKQTDLYLYPPEKGASPWCIIRVKAVHSDESGECMQYFLKLPSTGKQMEDVLVSPEIWKLPALTDKILKFVKTDLLLKVNEGGAALGGASDALESGESLSSQLDDDEEDLEDIDTSGILAGGDDADGAPAFDPMDIIASAQLEDDDAEDAGFDPESIIKEANESEGGDEATDDAESGFNPEDVIKD